MVNFELSNVIERDVFFRLFKRVGLYICIYSIDTDEIPGFFLLLKNHIFIARTRFFWNVISINKINRTIHGRLGIRILSSSAESISHKFALLTRERYFQHSKIKFVSSRDHVISFIYLIRWLTGSHCSCFRKGLIWSYLLVRVITQHSGHFVGDLSEIWVVHTITNWHQTNSEKRYGFLGTLLTSIGIPLLFNLFTRIGLQNRPSRSRGSPKGLQNRQYNMKVPYWPPPFIGSWGNTKEFS